MVMQMAANTEIKLSNEQQALFQVMENTRQHLFITGRAGAGKSVLLRHFRENTAKRIVVAAPTGIAALNVQGQTIHSLFKLPPELYRPGRLEPNSRLYTLLKRIDTLVIDEISMVRADLLDAIDERFREACKSDEPFGGKQLIMFGDVYQLPPVVDKDLMSYFEHVHNGYFFFNALAWKHAEFKIYELTQVFRQKDPIFKDILNAVRDGSFVDSQIEQLNARHGVAIPDDGKTITLAPTNSLVTNINQRRLDQLPGKAYEYKADLTGKMSKSTFPTEEVLQLKVGAQVVLLQNDKDKRWVNGSVATITALEKYSREEKTEDKITVRVDGIDYTLEKATWEEIKYEYDPEEGEVKANVVSSFTQFPIRLAWALTIHKSQGQTYESIALDLTTGTFAPGQMYVALSRATSMEGLYLKMPVQKKHIIVDPKVSDFMARREAIAVAEAVEEEIAQTIAEEASAIVEEAQAVSAVLYEQGSDAARAFVREAEIIAAVLSGEIDQSNQPEMTESKKSNAGRKPREGAQKVGYKFDIATVDFLNDLAKTQGKFDKSAWIERLIKQTPEYQMWLDAYQSSE